MMRRAALTACLTLALIPATPLHAQGFVSVYSGAEFRPEPRPAGRSARAAEVRRAVDAAMASLQRSPRPEPRGTAAPARVQTGSARHVCGDPALTGRALPRIKGKIKGCGVANPVQVTSVAGVRLSTPAIMDCQTAKTLKTWVNKGLKPAVGRRGDGVAELKVAASYACRARNSQKGAKISEHGKGHAIDISAITFHDGSQVSVLKHWGKGQNGRLLARLHAAACGPFGTVLGPESDRFHQDHFHFDTARYRSGSYCR